MTSSSNRPTMSLARLRKQAHTGEKIACLTAYDAAFAAQLDAAGIELVLVGDSLGMVVQGHRNTVPVNMDDMVYHTRCVARGLHHALLAADLPFMSYTTPEQALHNAARLMQEGGASIIKLEGGARQLKTVERLTEQNVPVCAHLGLQPQAIHKLGGYRVQGRDSASAARLEKDAKALAEAGADLLVLECVPTDLAALITANLDIPVIGIGAGAATHGQILVLYDMLGITPGGGPRFARDFMPTAGSIPAALTAYVQAVKQGTFPNADETL